MYKPHDSELNVPPKHNNYANTPVENVLNAKLMQKSIEELSRQVVAEEDNGQPLVAAETTLKIKINNKAVYKPEIIDAPYNLAGRGANLQNQKRRYLILTKEALEELRYSVEWGKRTRKNQVEQGGVLVGRVLQYKDEIYNEIKHILLADTKGSTAFVEFTPKMWADMQERLSEMNEKLSSETQMVITGWFHTHPNNLSVFMSGTDMRTQCLNFFQDWQASLVLNPHTKKLRVFFGAKATDGKIIFV
jgi:proteasome lid subunit RPN8/RPN11